MTLIREVIKRPLDQKIEEIIKLDQTDEDAVYTEITEYVVTDRISDEYRTVLRAIAEAPSDPSEGVGVWVSGFFGSGKSSFAKNLGYVLTNPEVCGTAAAELFKQQVSDHRVADLVDSINTRIPTEAVMFDLQVEQTVRKATERMAEIMYTALLRHLGYAEDYDLAELELDLEGNGALEDFKQRCLARYQKPWEMVRKSALKISQASAILHEVDPATFPSADSWATSLGQSKADITIGKFVDRAFELLQRRRPGKALVFIVDEVGGYVARSADKIEDLRAVVEQFGKESRNRVKAKKAVAPVWVVVTSQEKLDEVVAAIDSKRVELARLQDRFKYHVDLSPADIRQVATRRVLSKKDEAVPVLEMLYADNREVLEPAVRLERTSRQSEVSQESFVAFYPYLPHFIELSIDIVSGIRLQPGAVRQLGGSNRTIIKQAYEMLVSERTDFADKTVGALVTLDRIYDLVEGSLSSEKRKDMTNIGERFKSDPADQGWAERTAKAIALLEFVRDLPRTAGNIAAVLVAQVGAPKPLAQVESALERLKAAQFVRETEEGYKLQTAQEKNWDTERHTHLAPKPKDRNDIKREALAEVFTEPKVKTYRYKNLRSFDVGVSVDGTRVGSEGSILLSVVTADDAGELGARLDQARTESRQASHQNDVYWVFALTPELDDLMAELYASRQMVLKYDQMRAQNQITAEETTLLSAEKQEATRLLARLREKLEAGLVAGTGQFRGVARDGSGLGTSVSEVFQKLLDAVIPDLFPRLEMGVRPLRGSEAEEVLKAANLSGLPQGLYDGAQGFGLIVQDGARWVPNQSADVAKEVLDYLRREHSYGTKVTGKSLEEHFGGLGYGWEREVLRLVLAVMLRAGAVEVTYQGRRFRGHQDPQSRVPFSSNLAFRAASFAPRETVDLRTLTGAVEQYEALTGGEVDVEEAAIAAAARKLADDELKLLLPLEATAQANDLPVLDQLREYRSNLETIQNADSDGCVHILAGEGKSLRATREQVRQIRQALAPDGPGIPTVRQARDVVRQVLPVLAGRVDGMVESDVQGLSQTLQAGLRSPDFFEHLDDLAERANAALAAYRELYERTHGVPDGNGGWLHAGRTAGYEAAIQEVRGRPGWAALPADAQQTLVEPLTRRACMDLKVDEHAFVCASCRATVPQMESDIAALNGVKAEVLARLEKLVAPDQKVERLKLSSYFSASPRSHEDVDLALEQLRGDLYKLVDAQTRIVLE